MESGAGPPPLLELIDVRKSYGEVKALSGVSLCVRPGQVVALLGPNGAGKSTLLSIAAALLTADGGEVVVAPGVRIGLMPQEHAIYPMLTARENLTFIARAVGLSRDQIAGEVARVLSRVNLADRADDRVGGFSGGMKRRLGFASAVLGGPQVLLLDEPTVGVDPQSRLSLLELVEEQVAEGVGVVYSTHYMEEAERIADTVTVLHEGLVQAAGTLGEIVSAQCETHLEVVVRGTGADGFTMALTGDPAVSVLESPSPAEPCSARLRMATGDWTATLQLLAEASRAHGVRIHDMRFDEPTLESAFLSLTGREVAS